MRGKKNPCNKWAHMVTGGEFLLGESWQEAFRSRELWVIELGMMKWEL